MTEYTPHGYQSRAIDFLIATQSGALFLDPGLGKTSITLSALDRLFNSFDIARVLVVAPLRVVKSVWKQEGSKWDHLREISFSMIVGNADQRMVALSQKADVYLINYENLPWLLDNGCFDFDVVVFDEATKMKSPKSKRFKKFRRVLPDVDRVWLLTGSPASNGLLDIWGLAFLLDRGERLGKTFSGFRDRYFMSDYHGYNWTLREGADEKIYDKLSDLCLTLSAKDYLDLPERVDNVIKVELSPWNRRTYEALERDFLAEIEEETIEVLHAAALTNKLLQFANGAVYTDDQGAWSEVHDAKLEALSEIVDGASGAPILVAYNYKTDLERLLKRFPKAQTLGKDTKQIEAWNRGEIPILLAHPASAGHGLNLQAGGNVIVWFGLNWSLELYQQFNARLHRQGQDRPVIVHHLVTSDTVDETVMAALDRKDTTQRALLNALKSDIEGRI